MNKGFTKKVAIALIFTGAGSLLSIPAMASASGFPTGGTGKSASGDQVVYMKYDGDWDVYRYDLHTGEERQITAAPGSQGYPAVYGNYIVWQDNREYPNERLAKYDIFLFDQTSGHEKKISQHEGYNQDVKMSGDHVVWLDNGSGKSSVYVYDISTGIEKKITSDQANAFGVQISGNELVWMDARNGDLDIYGYNLQSGQETRITSDTSKQADPKISGDQIVWHDYRDGVRQIHEFDLESGVEKQLTSGSSDHTALGFDGGKLLYREEGGRNRLMLYDVQTGQHLQLLGVSSNSVFMNGGKVYWLQGAQLQSASIEQLVLPSAPVSSGSASATSEGDWTTVSLQGGTVVSADKRVSLLIPSGVLQREVTFRITKGQELPIKAQRNSAYQTVTDFYTVETRDGEIVQGDFQLQFHDVTSWSDTWDARKFVVQRMDPSQEKWINVRSKIPFDGKVKVAGDQLGTFTLTYFNSPLQDTGGHWAKGFIETLAAQGILNGYEDKTFQPDRTVTRAEFVTMLENAFDLSSLPQVQAQSLQDVTGHWAASHIRTAAEKGIVAGAEGRFRPNDAVTRQEMVAMLMRALHESLPHADSFADALAKFVDKQAVSSWAKPFMQQAVSLGIVQGDDGILAPLDKTTRAQAATVIYRTLEQVGGDAQ